MMNLFNPVFAFIPILPLIVVAGTLVCSVLGGCFLYKFLSKSSKNVFIRIYGPRGSGKTTFLKNFKREIREGQTLRSTNYEVEFKFESADKEEKVFSLKVRDTVGEKDSQTDEVDKIDKGGSLIVLIFSDECLYLKDSKYRRECNSTLEGVFQKIGINKDCGVFFVFTHKDLLKSSDQEGRELLKKEFSRLSSENIFSINAKEESDVMGTLKEVLEKVGG